jgi:hypothetical protein
MWHKELKDKSKFLLKSTGKVHINYGEDNLGPGFISDEDHIEVVSACGTWANKKDVEESKEEITCKICRNMLFKEKVVDAVKNNGGKIKPNLSLTLGKRAQEVVLNYAVNNPTNAGSINEIIVEVLELYGGKL